MVGIRSVGVDERQSEDSFVCFSIKPTQSACAGDFLRDREKRGKVRSQAVNR